MGKRLWSVFTDDMDHCYFTGSPYVERHHIFESRKGFKKNPSGEALRFRCGQTCIQTGHISRLHRRIIRLTGC